MMRFLRKARKSNARVGIAIDDTRVCYAEVQAAAEGVPRLRVGLQGIEDADTPKPDWLCASPAAMTLDQADYRLQLVELPNVPDEELGAAMHWQAKDMVDYPVDEALVDYIRIPRHVGVNSKPMGYAAVAHEPVVTQVIRTHGAGSAQVDAVDLSETSLHNVARLLPQEKFGVALLHFTEHCGYLIVSREGTLHLIRRINHGSSAIANALTDDFSTQEMAAGMSLEIQRSLDYYESHYDCKPINEIVLTPVGGLGPLPDLLRTNLGLDVSRLDFSDHFELEAPLTDEEQSACVIAIGAALRTEPSDDPDALKQTIDLLPHQDDEAGPAFSIDFMVRAAAAGIATMSLLGWYASNRIDALQADLDFSSRQEQIALRHLEEAGQTIRHAIGAESWDTRRETLERDLREKQAMLTLLQGEQLGETGGFSPHLRALSRQDIDGIWLTGINLRAAINSTRLNGLTLKAELVPAYVQLLTQEAPFEAEGFQEFRIDSPDNAGDPLVFAMSGQPSEDLAQASVRP
ncbi:MAG: hypothetical protein AAGA44_16295 [Pseudomonadota bacterium]